jgi:hypothetical protein
MFRYEIFKEAKLDDLVRKVNDQVQSSKDRNGPQVRLVQIFQESAAGQFAAGQFVAVLEQTLARS